MSARGVVAILVATMAILLLGGTGASASGGGVGGRVAVATSGPKAGASVIGGYLPSASSWPWVVALVKPSQPTTIYCGGTVVDPTRILTAAHCLYGHDASYLQVVVGRRKLSNTATGEQVPIARVALHPGYAKQASGGSVNDVAVLTLSHPVSVQPATLGAESDWSTQVTSMGWGHVNHEENIYSDDLLAVDLATWTDQQCAGAWGADYVPTANFCAGGDGTRGTCHGDSGGPVMVTPDSGLTWRLIGVNSWAPLTCVVYGRPAVYAWAAGATLRSWIAAAIAEPLPPPASPPPAPPAAPPTAAKMSKGQAILDLRTLVRRKTGHRAKYLATRCRRTSAASFSCAASFAANGWGYGGNFKVSVYVGSDNVLHWTGVFKGRRSNGRGVRWSL